MRTETFMHLDVPTFKATHCRWGHATVALKLTPRDGEQGGWFVEMGMSFCRPDDQFVKKIGRIKALGQLASHSPTRHAICFDYNESEGITVKEKAYKLFLEYLFTKRGPSWAHRLIVR